MKLNGSDNNITIQGANVHLGDGLPVYARASILRIAGKYFGCLNTASAHFSRDGAAYRCSITMRMGGLPVKSAESRDRDIYTAFDTALIKVAKQLRRMKRELREDQPLRADRDMALRDGLGLPPVL
ncbi:ribosome hibernation-promoting factor, HPF/YfiA family [Microvirga arsenatis]|uniref:Ribosome-associated translation inhibitor RaiA n=1 Tax=Microvirga arsenatis TaxID=2692265 RepID=A0ABW9YVQ2_9HYPH|nr:ribosome-associated translation inhibitor RaiA [Microvirga arsenatis]NBJ10696.1 ribosome-associated translation inhibitor RaiA [Microvirga arsenatis]NBJ24406.1 ribosome-associated translation inhibitor RaiA [Microvirga arsenatis]